MFVHTHPYQPFLFKEATKLIVGTLPPPRFTTKELKDGDVDFCYGSKDGYLWPILERIFAIGLTFENSKDEIAKRKAFLKERGIGICDIVESAERYKIDASDLGMHNIELRDVVAQLNLFPKVHTLLFTGGNSKNGPEYFFRRQLKQYRIKLELVNNIVPRIHSFELKGESGIKRTIKTVSLTAPSGAANRAIGSLDDYKGMKQEDVNFNTIDYRVLQYRPFF